MHHADDETIVAHVKVLPQAAPGTKRLARFSGPHTLSVESVAQVILPRNQEVDSLLS